MDILFRRAEPSESGQLTDLAHRSKSHWDYPEDWIRLWRDALTLSPDLIRLNQVYVATCAGRVAGVYALMAGDGECELEHFWLDPEFMGRGIGTSLLRHAIETARGLNASRLTILSDPNAEGFYLKMGARRVGSRPSTPAGRRLPLLILETG
jgi:GNAT superfamily N-acetyltransferase